MVIKIFIKFFLILVLVYNYSFASQKFFHKFHKLKINSYTEKTPIKSGIIRGNVDSYPFGFDYYVSSKDGKILELIETFFIDNYGDHLSRFDRSTRSIVFGSNPNNGCNNSEEKIYHAILDNGNMHYTCFSIKILTNKEELWGPNFNGNDHIPTEQRKVTAKRFLKKNQYMIPEKMLRVEHYFYKSGKLIWVFYTIDAKLFFDELNQNNLKKFVNVAIQRHKDFEKDLRYKKYHQIQFD
tara:strand:- start:143 stop:859 length:717 start_codon:yes stop_codon:yes gene_type:complete